MFNPGLGWRTWSWSSFCTTGTIFKERWLHQIWNSVHKIISRCKVNYHVETLSWWQLMHLQNWCKTLLKAKWGDYGFPIKTNPPPQEQAEAGVEHWSIDNKIPKTTHCGKAYNHSPKIFPMCPVPPGPYTPMRRLLVWIFYPSESAFFADVNLGF